ncbi:putative nucleotidyltransferase, ribonuclease H [Tanacetum coccineum]|uniref:Nucleotidyltransferase, ribonuclease H n=1 Tax=Tanacetum coccineum TaxID=301880 RepID=A0ABQ4Z8I9_9ASTR
MHGTLDSICVRREISEDYVFIFGRNYRKLGELVLSSVQHSSSNDGIWENICAGGVCPTKSSLACYIQGSTLRALYGQHSPRFIGPFEILERIGEVSYRLALPPHLIFRLSEEPESILDRQERVMRNKVIPFVKILWKNHPEREATWETEESMRASYPHFFV